MRQNLWLALILAVLAVVYLTLPDLRLVTAVVIGLVYFSLLLAMTYIINFSVSRLYKNKKYPIKARDIVRDIK